MKNNDSDLQMNGQTQL